MKTILLIIATLLLFAGCDKTTPKKSVQAPPPDTKAPLLVLKGDADITLPINHTYQEPGFSAMDDVDGDVSNKVTITGSVDTSRVGVYTLTYLASDSSGNLAQLSRSVRVTTFANARLGALSDANITIYSLSFDTNGTPKKLLYQEQSSGGYTLDKIGHFDTHAEKLKSGVLYLIQIEHGSDFDLNNNGIKDGKSIENNGTLRALVTKEEIVQLAQRLNVTPLSEIVYESLAQKLHYNPNRNDILKARDAVAKELVEDIDSDGKVDYKDILSFNPATNQRALLGPLHNNYNYYANVIREGKLPLLNSTQRVANIPTYHFARSITANSNKSKLYVADGDAGITVINRATNRIIRNIKTKGFARHITLSTDETLAYVADSQSGLSVVDLASRDIIANIPTYDSNSSGDHDARYSILDGNTLFVAASKSGVLEFDVTNPKKPLLKKQFHTPDIAYNIKLSSSRQTLFIADGKTGLIAVDIDSNKTLGTFDTYGSANGVTLSSDESRAYIADGTKGMVVADISDLENISYITHIDTPDFATSITLNSDESRAYIADRKSNVQVVDLTKETLSIIQSIATPYRSYGVTLSQNENSIYVATGTNGVELLALDTLPQPLIVSKVPSDYKAYRVYKRGDLAFVLQGRAGLQIVDIHNIQSPTILSTYDTDGFSMDIVIDGTIAYLADGYKGIKKVDISDPANVALLNEVDTDGFTSTIKSIPNSNLLLASDGTKGVKLFDKESLSLLDTLKTPAKALDITLSKDGTRAYVALGKGGVGIIDITGEHLELQKSVATNSYVKHITLDRQKAYLNGDGSAILVMNLTNGAITQTIPAGDFSYKTVMDENYYYIANGKDGIEILNKQSLEKVGSIVCGGDIRDIALDNGVIYAAASESGLCTVDERLLLK